MNKKSSPLRILQVIDRTDIGGAERVFLDIVQLLLNEGLKVDTLLISGKGALYNSIDSRAKIFFLNRNNKFNIFKILKCASICANYDIVHVHMRYTYVRLAQLISMRNFKIVLHDHFGDIDFDMSTSFKLKGIFKPRYYIGVSQKLIDWSSTQLKVNKRYIFLLRNTIITIGQNKLLSYNQEWIMISNIRQTKNIELAIELAQHLKKMLIIYGNVEQTEYSKKILKLIGCSPFVRLIQGEPNAQQYLMNFKLAIHTALSETGPLVLLEYLSKGLPFLSHLTGEVAHLLQDEIPECFVSTLDEANWIKKLENLEQNPPTPQKLKALFGKYFGNKQYIEQCLKIYQKVADF